MEKYRLSELVEQAKKYHMSPEEQEAQRRSFAWGNAHFENPHITRELVDSVAEELASEKLFLIK